MPRVSRVLLGHIRVKVQAQSATYAQSTFSAVIVVLRPACRVQPAHQTPHAIKTTVAFSQAAQIVIANVMLATLATGHSATRVIKAPLKAVWETKPVCRVRLDSTARKWPVPRVLNT